MSYVLSNVLHQIYGYTQHESSKAKLYVNKTKINLHALGVPAWVVLDRFDLGMPWLQFCAGEDGFQLLAGSKVCHGQVLSYLYLTTEFVEPYIMKIKCDTRSAILHFLILIVKHYLVINITTITTAKQGRQSRESISNIFGLNHMSSREERAEFRVKELAIFCAIVQLLLSKRSTGFFF